VFNSTVQFSAHKNNILNVTQLLIDGIIIRCLLIFLLAANITVTYFGHFVCLNQQHNSGHAYLHTYSKQTSEHMLYINLRKLLVNIPGPLVDIYSNETTLYHDDDTEVT